MEVICHIGHHKTGTTTLQAFLSQNSHRLLQAGILYPWVEMQGAAHALAKAMGRGDRQEILPINIREAHNALAFRILADALPNWTVPPYHHNLPHSRQMMLALSNQISSLKPGTIVLCSEVMSHFGKIATGQISRLRQEGLGEAEKFALWCTLRRPDEQLVSWHGQQLRFGQAPAPLSDAEHGLNLHWLHVDYRGVIEPWLQQIPEARPILRPYRETMAVGGSVEDFLTNSGLEAPRGLLPASTMNVSYKPAVISLLRLANGQLPRELARELADSVEVLTDGMRLAGSAEVEFLGPVSRARLVEHFAPIHKWLSQTSGRSAFFADIDNMATCRPISEKAAFQGLLDQLTPRHIAKMARPEIRDFLTGLRNKGAML
jgi:hypothetical protein